MDRRTSLSILGTAGLGGGVLFVGYQLQQGNLELGDSSEVSAEVEGGGETFTFDASAGDEIFITVREKSQDDVTAGFTLRDPDGDELLDRELRSAMGETRKTETAERDGTYSLSVSTGGRVQVNVQVTGPDA